MVNIMGSVFLESIAGTSKFEFAEIPIRRLNTHSTEHAQVNDDGKYRIYTTYYGTQV